MDSVFIGKGKMAGKGVYAARDFNKGELVKVYNLTLLTQTMYDALPENERMFVHSFWGKMYLFPEPSRYTNHSATPNTYSDVNQMCDYASRFIPQGEMITTNATIEVRKELETFVQALEGSSVSDFEWYRGGYRNARVRYTMNNKVKDLRLKRQAGNWRIVS